MKLSRMSGFFGAALLLSLTSCAYKFVKKPAIHVVKRAAIVSVYSNRALYALGGGGGLTQGLSVLGSMAGKKKAEGDKTPLQPDFGGTRMVEYALSEFTKELNQVHGWKIVPFEQLKSNPDYQTFVQKKQSEVETLGKTIALLAKTQWTTVPGMTTYDLGNRLEKTPQTKELAQLCKKLGVDGVVVVKLDMAYASHTGVGSVTGGMTGSATAAVSTDMAMVTKEGKFGVLTKKGGSKQFKSDGKTLMVAGNVAFNDKTEKMYKEAIAKNAQFFREQINKTIK